MKKELIVFSSFDVIAQTINLRLKEKHLKHFLDLKNNAKKDLYFTTLVAFEDGREHDLLEFASDLYICGEIEEAMNILLTIYEVKLRGQCQRIKELQEILAYKGIFFDKERGLWEIAQDFLEAQSLWIDYIFSVYSPRDITLCLDLYSVTSCFELDYFEDSLRICLEENNF